MLPIPLQTNSLPTSSIGRRGPGTHPASLVLASAGRVPETLEQSAASVEDILRREPDFAEPVTATRHERREHITGAGMVFATVGATGILIALVATATVLVMRWFA